jgi:hypothetical protein
MKEVKNSLNNSNKIVILKGNNDEIIKTIMKNKEKSIFHIKRKTSKKLFYLLVTNTKVKKILISEPVFNQTSKKNIEALKGLNIEVKIIKNKRGRPKKYNEKEIKKIKKYKTAKRKYNLSKTSFYKLKKQKNE